MLSGLTSKEKAAAIMISIGAEEASKVYKYLREDEVEQLTYEIARLQRLTPSQLDAVLNDFYDICLAQKVVTEGGLEYARDILEKAYGSQTANHLLERVAKSLRTKAFEFIRKADYKNLMAIIQSEHPQTIALILSYARSDQASTIISELPNSIKIEVVERIANMDRTSPEMIKEVERTLERKFSTIVSSDYTQIGGVDYIAEIMNNLDRSTEKYIFDELGKKDAKLADEIRMRMFVFEDIISLDASHIQRFLREVDAKDLAIALKGSNEEVQRVVFENMSKRMAETIKSDIEYLVNVRIREVEDAQQRIVAIIRKLEENGEVIINKGGKDELFV